MLSQTYSVQRPAVSEEIQVHRARRSRRQRFDSAVLFVCSFSDAYSSKYVDGRIILRWIFRKLEGVVGTGWSGLRIGTVGGHL
jgi:hypothetical protein